MAGIKWKRKEINVLEIDYPKYGIEYCSIKLSRSHNSIKIKASRLNINKYFEWNDEKVSFLIKNYPNSSRRECAEQLGISLYQLKEKAQQIGLKRKFLSKKERENLPKNKMIKNLRTRLYLAIKKNKKINHSVVLFGCSILKLKEHLESKFKEGMSWDIMDFMDGT
jgi:hypothetical protein